MNEIIKLLNKIRSNLEDTLAYVPMLSGQPTFVKALKQLSEAISLLEKHG